MRDTIRGWLAGDATLMALLTGGLYAGTEISRQGTPAAFDANSEVLPCGLVHLETQAPHGPYDTSARLFLTVICYQRAGYDVIDAALDEVYVRLHGSRTGVTSGVWEVRQVDDSPDLADQGLGCAMRYSRYEVVRLRGTE